MNEAKLLVEIQRLVDKGEELKAIVNRMLNELDAIDVQINEKTLKIKEIRNGQTR